MYGLADRKTHTTYTYSDIEQVYTCKCTPIYIHTHFAKSRLT